MRTITLRAFCFVLLFGAILCLRPPPLEAGTNSALGGVGGLNNGMLLGGDGSGRAQFTVNSISLSLVKQARDAEGVLLPSGEGVDAGQVVYFVLYVENPTVAAARDLRIVDELDEEQFTYIPNSLEKTLVGAGADDDRLWSSSWSPLTDALDDADDAASAVDTGGSPGPDRITVGSASAQPNRRLILPPRSRYAVRFQVRVN